MIVDVVVLNYNSGFIIERCMASLFKFDNVNIIVVDNGSSDISIKLLEELAKRDIITLIKNEKNLGCPEGLNKAIPYLKNKYVAFLNEDVFPLKGWLDEPIILLEWNDKIGAIGFSLYNEQGELETGGNFIDILTGTAGGMKLDNKEWFYTTYTGLGNLIMRTELFKLIGEFNNKYFLYWDDAEYCIRINKAGYHVVSVPSSKAIHLRGWSVNRNVNDLLRYYYPFRNSILTLLIHGNRREIITYLPLNYLYKIIVMTANTIHKLKRRNKLKGLHSGLMELCSFICYSFYSTIWIFINIKWILKCRKEVYNKDSISYESICKMHRKTYSGSRIIVKQFHKLFEGLHE